MLPSSLRFLRSYSTTSAQTITQYSPFHLLQILQLSIDHKCLLLTQKSHVLICSLGLTRHSFLATKLISAYSNCGLLSHSRLLFNSISPSNVFLYNTMITGCTKNGSYQDAFHLFDEMRVHNISPDDYTLATLLKASAELKDLKTGQAIHGLIVKTGFDSEIVLMNSLMSMYCKSESFRDVRKVFDEMPQRNSSSWNVLISRYAVLGSFVFDKDVREVVQKMQIDGVSLDSYTASILLPLCTTNGNNDNDNATAVKCDLGREIHCFILKSNANVDLDIHVCCCLIDMYSKAKNILTSRSVFDRMSNRNIVAWTAMINGYIHNGFCDEALKLFVRMQTRGGIEPNRVSLISVLPACSNLCSLMEGKQIHGFAIRKEFISEVSMRNALIDMYSKCGNLNSARRLFDDNLFVKDSISWSSMISAYGLHGDGDKAISLFNEMLQLGIKPDNITIVGVLSACCRSGSIREGIHIYKSLTTNFGISPTSEICSCVVDMLGRSGMLDQALEFIKSTPFKAGANIWGALFDASIIHANSEMRDLAYKALTHLEPENPSNYVSLSNVFASSGRWDAVMDLRTTMNERGLRKLPGCSWIMIGNQMHSFYVADKKHSCSPLIYEILDHLILTMKETLLPRFDIVM